MRVKKITPTAEYKPIEFRELIGHGRAAVLGPSTGSPSAVEFKTVKRFGCIKRGPTIVLNHYGDQTGPGMLVCDPSHRVMTTNGEKFVRDLDEITDRLVGMTGPVHFTKMMGGVEDLYDIEIDAPHLYYTSGLVSHNSIWLSNCSVNSVLAGYDTLHVTFEMSAHKTARRCLGALTEVPLKDFHNHRGFIRDRCGRVFSTNKAQLAIYEMNPDECSVEDVRNLISMLRRTRGFSPKVVCLDYLELMLSRNDYYNRDEYVRQKHVATEVCGFAKTEGCFVYSATQTNRSGTGTANSADIADLNKIAESYGKSMPPDYVISLNQSKEERHADPPVIRMYIAKNREGDKFVTIDCYVNYSNMKVREASL